MMKYIRTKDGIYERTSVVRQVCDNKEVAVIRYDKLEFEPIIKTADTIEELCDEFVIDFGKTNRITQRYSLFYDFELAKLEVNDREKNFYRYLNEDFVLYGAIWTDKGLIYVAKMNEEGKLELL